MDFAHGCRLHGTEELLCGRSASPLAPRRSVMRPARAAAPGKVLIGSRSISLLLGGEQAYAVNFCPLSSICWSAKIVSAWAEDRALLGSNLSAVPGAGSKWGVAVPPPLALCSWRGRVRRATCF